MRSRRSRRRPRRSWLRRSALLLTIFVVAVAALVVNVWSPPTDPEPTRVDAVIQLGGVPVDVYESARGFGERGVTTNVVLSNVVRDYPRQAAPLCRPRAGVATVTCFDPDPATTRGEAREIGRLAAERGWHSIYVRAADEAHVTRAEFIISRCLPDDVDLQMGFHAVGRTHKQRLKLWEYQYGGWLKALSEDGC